jgi:hypothetical protein
VIDMAVDLLLYINNERDLYDKKIEHFKSLWSHYKEYGKVGNDRILFMPLIRSAKKHHYKAMRDWTGKGIPKHLLVTEKDLMDAYDGLVEEFKSEVIELKNYDWVK